MGVTTDPIADDPDDAPVVLRSGPLDGSVVTAPRDAPAVEVTMADRSRWRYRRTADTEQRQGRRLPVFRSEGRR